jgi:ribonuclease BN (tRNA processing enzyme)
VARLVPCHFSPRYGGRSAALSKEAERAFRGSDARDEIDTDLPSAT